jgi:hypothetical protein
MRHLVVTLLTIAAICSTNAQEIATDSLRTKVESTLHSHIDTPEASLQKPDRLYNRQATYTPDSIRKMPNGDLPVSIEIESPGLAPLASWNGGDVTASGRIDIMPGMMAVNSGAIALRQRIDNLTLTLSGNAAKYGYYGGILNQYGVSASATYDFNKRYGITLFGEYYTGSTTPNIYPAAGPAMTPAMVGYLNSTNFGGYFNYKLNSHWGINLGAQSYRSLRSNQWEVAPIAEPYYQFNNGKRLGVDVGGILYEILRNSSGKNFGPRNPTIGPPTH